MKSNFFKKEKTILIIREHKILLLGRLFLWLFILIIPFVAKYLVLQYNLFSATSIYTNIFNLVVNLYLLYTFFGLLVLLTLYHLNTRILTNKRIIDIDQKSLFKHQTTEIHLNQVQDVSYEITGFWGHIFNYGDVDIQTAGDIAKVTFEKAPNPKKVKRLIADNSYSHQK